MADNENTPIVETTVDGEPGTGEQNDTTPKADSNDLADKVSMWQAMSRENEKKSHANLKRATEAENKLADVEHQYAQAQAQIAKLPRMRTPKPSRSGRRTHPSSFFPRRPKRLPTMGRKKNSSSPCPPPYWRDTAIRRLILKVRRPVAD